MITILRNTEIFRELPETALEKLSEKLRERVCPPNMAIVREGASGNAMFIIKDGRVEVKKKDQKTGSEVVLATLGAGSIFGEEALMLGKPRFATIVTVVATEILVLRNNDFDFLFTEHPDIADSIVRSFLERIPPENRGEYVGDIVSMQTLAIDPEAATITPEDTALKYKMLATSYNACSVTLAMVNPRDAAAISEAQKLIMETFRSPLDIDRVIVTGDSFRQFMESDYGTITRPASRKKVAPKIELVISIVSRALRSGASDIHIEPLEDRISLKYRIAGMLREEMTFPPTVYPSLLCAIRHIAHLDDKNNSGNVIIKFQSNSAKLHVSTIPTLTGERVCMNLLNENDTISGLDNLISYGPTLDIVRDLIRKPYGIIFVAGPDATGRTSTLYSILSEVNNPYLNIFSIEDPVEHAVEGVNQVEANRAGQFNFAEAIKSVLNQDPDIIAVGETRDEETLKILFRAALGGCLAIAAIEANDCADVFTRLDGMGIDRYVVSTSILGVITERRLGKICSVCREEYVPDPGTLKYFNLPDKTVLYRGKGCDRCNGIGCKGYVGAYEVLYVDDGIRSLITETADPLAIRDAAIRNGMKTLKDYCCILLQEGMTTATSVVANQ